MNTRVVPVENSDVGTTILDLISVLGKMPRNLPEYYQRLIGHDDLFLRVGGMAALLDLNALPEEQWDDAISLCAYGAVARRAFDFFIQANEYDHARRVVGMLERVPPHRPTDNMKAVLDLDWAAQAELEVQQFLADGDVSHLTLAGDHFESAAGWRAAVIWAARAAVLHPIVPNTAAMLLNLLENANQDGLISDILKIFTRGEVFPLVCRIFAGALLVRQKKAREGLTHLSAIVIDSVPTPHLRAKIFVDRARAHEMLGNYREAFDCYRKKNEQQLTPEKIDPAGFLRNIRKLTAVDYGALGEDAHDDYFMMVGFARSGTTLLENALDAHPEVQAFEEQPALRSTTRQIGIVADKKIKDPAIRRAAFEEARQRYYIEFERRRQKAGVRAWVDKNPMYSAHIEYLEKLFPRKRYIFSIRHPYDVVLSCFKQTFKGNPAMENFRSFGRACSLYDDVMSTWFRAFPGENDRVLYVRYDDLVEHFEREMSRAFGFLGVAWDSAVLQFAERSDAKRASTPSYVKVRAGLSIGVQSSWRNYKFMFDTKEAAVLNKWVDRFGYER